MFLVSFRYAGALNFANDASELGFLEDRNIELLSGGELQRFAIALTCVRKADVYVTSCIQCRTKYADGHCIVICLTNHPHSLMSSNVLQLVE